jgi:hypothetical protein
VREFGNALSGKVIVDISNPFDSDLTALVTPDDSSSAQEIAKVTPAGAHVVRAFDTVFGHVLAAHTSEDPRPLDVFITGDDAGAQGTRVIVRREPLAATARRRRPEGRSLARRSEHAVGARDVRKGCQHQQLLHRPQRSRLTADANR